MDLDASVKEKIVVHAGATIRIIAYVSGKPAPQITWCRDDGEVPKEAVVETTGISNSLVIKNCQRQHQGMYTLIAKNEGGERRKVVIVEVLGESSSEVSNVSSFLSLLLFKKLYFLSILSLTSSSSLQMFPDLSVCPSLARISPMTPVS